MRSVPQGYSNPIRTLRMVGVRGLEPRASCSQSRRATNCATPRYEVFAWERLCSQSKRATNCATPGYGIFNCGQTCGQRRFLTGYRRGGNCCCPMCPKGFQTFRVLRSEPGPPASKQALCQQNSPCQNLTDDPRHFPKYQHSPKSIPSSGQTLTAIV